MSTATLPERELAATLPTATWRDWSCQVRLVVTDPAVLVAASADLSALMARIERAASRFRPDSELSRANRQAGRPVAVSRLLVELVDTALAEAARSGGALDPVLGHDLVRLGYDRDISELAGRAIAAPAGPGRRPNWRQLRLDRTAGLLTVPAGAALDLGASAKSQAADWAAAELADRYGGSVLVEIGGDLAVAGPKADWQIAVAERAGGRQRQQVSLHSGGLATSTTTIRAWQAGEQVLHHIIDPATGQPADGPWRTVTVAAASAVHANTCSTSAIVLGARAPAWLAGQGVAARLIGLTGELVVLGGWPEPAVSTC
ncbi:MAG: FAD:protein FMN transferase [Jatrophihabitantaceae bacterium]